MKTTYFPRRIILASLLSLTSLAGLAEDRLPRDVPGASDPVFLKRFSGSTLIGYKTEPWASTRFPTTATVDKSAAGKPFKDLVEVEGARIRAVYLAPQDKSPLEVYRNYEQALNAAGFKKKFACESNCADQFLSLGKLEVDSGLTWATGLIPDKTHGSYNPDTVMTYEEGRLLVGTLPREGAETWVMLYVSKAVNGNTRYSQAFVEVLAPKAMQTGQVTVLKASDIETAMTSDGKVALYGLYFDTGKSEIKPDSKPQLEQMARYLASHGATKVFVVGHTDGQGQFEANQQLSQRRAQAVVDALVAQGIDAKRLEAKGIASLSPVSTNASEEGRARNRRVELVIR